MLRRCVRRLGQQTKGNRYVDGSGRQLEGSSMPTDLYVQPISDHQYPVRGDHWQPVVAGQPSPYRGNIVIAGGGVVGCATGCMFALRGWHVTILEKKSRPSLDDKYAALETVLLNKRAADSLHMAGVRIPELKMMGGRKVLGLMEHPGNMSTFFTRGLVERTNFPVNMLTCDLNTLRFHFNRHVESLPSDNARVFHNHTVAALFPEQKTCVLKPLREHERDSNPFTDQQMSWESFQTIKAEQEGEEKALTTETVRWEDNVEGIDYDVMIACDGANSKVRTMLGTGQTHYGQWGVLWFGVKNSKMPNEYVHQWAHRFDDYEDHKKNIGFVQALPRSEPGVFSVMLYMPVPILEKLTIEQLREKYCRDLDGDTDIVSPHIKPHPTVYSQLTNSEAFPNICLVGDAAHACSPYLNQSLGISLEDAAFCVNQIDSRVRNQWDSIRAYGRERGVAGDALRLITERSMYYTKQKQWNAVLRLRNLYYHAMHYVCPRDFNELFEASNNYVYPRSIGVMLNGRGYGSFELAEYQQYRANRWWCLGRLYT